MVSEDIKDSVINNTRNLLLGHVTVGMVTSPQINDNMLIETASPLKSTIRMNVYQQPVKVTFLFITPQYFCNVNFP
jgi:hypothetical protein